MKISRKLRILLIFVALIIAFRAVLPIAVEHYVNKQLAHLEDYSGKIDDVDLAIIRGAYRIEGLELVKTGGKVPVPFFSTPEIDISLEWKALFDGAIVSEIEVIRPELNIVDGPTPATSQKTVKSDWRKVVEGLIPIDLNRVSLRSGEIRFRNLTSQPPVDVHLTKLDIDALNLSNSKERAKKLPSTIAMKAVAMGDAPIDMRMTLNPLSDPMDFDLNGKLRDLSLPKLNAFLKEYGNLDVHNGTLTLDTELAAKDGALTGYLKPVMKDLDVVKANEDAKDGPINLVFQTLAGTVGDLLQNDDKQGVRIPIEGSLKNPKMDTWASIGSAFKHAFGKPLSPGLENSVNLQSAETKESEEKPKAE